MGRMRKAAAVGIAATMALALFAGTATFGAEPAKKKTGARTGQKKRAAQPAEAATAPQPAEVPPDTIQGYYEGTFTGGKGGTKAEARVIAEFVRAGTEVKKSYRVLLSTLPADEPQALKAELKGVRADDALPLSGQAGGVEWTGQVGGGKLALEGKGDAGGKWALTRVVQHSPAEGAKPPAGAVVLLPFEPGKPTNLDEWRNKNWKLLPDGSMEAFKGNNLTVKEFGSCKLHVEFMTPYQPEARGQGRGNSGVYMQDRYETQVLDSFGLAAKNNECGGIYEVSDPRQNVCYPPLQWQTYDITFTAPKFAADGTVQEPAKLTVVQNGAEIQKDVAVKGPTRAAGGKGVVPLGPLELQDHGCPARYRNIWLVETKE